MKRSRSSTRSKSLKTLNGEEEDSDSDTDTEEEIIKRLTQRRRKSTTLDQESPARSRRRNSTTDDKSSTTPVATLLKRVLDGFESMEEDDNEVGDNQLNNSNAVASGSGLNRNQIYSKATPEFSLTPQLSQYHNRSRRTVSRTVTPHQSTPQPRNNSVEPSNRSNKKRIRPKLMEGDSDEEREYETQSQRYRKKLSLVEKLEIEKAKAEKSQRNGRAEISELELNRLRELETAGTIEELHLVNFMCHRNFSAKFTNGINLVSGNNGTGKSAITAALSLLLGGSTSTIARGNLIGLIRTATTGEVAQEPAEISVRLSNRGSRAFRPKDFGNSITITRRLNTSGTTTWKIIESKGTIKGTQASLVREIMETFGLSISNQLVLLPQEKAKSFYHEVSSNSTKLYGFWNEATGLKGLKSNYDEIGISIEQIRRSRKKHLIILKEIEEQEKKAEITVKSANKLENMRKSLKNFEIKLKWRKANDLDKNLLRLRKDLEHNLEAHDEYTKRCEADKINLNEIEESQKSSANTREVMESSIKKLDDQKEVILGKRRRTQAETQLLKDNIRTISHDIETYQNSFEDASQNFKDIQEKESQEKENSENRSIKIGQQIDFLRSERSLLEAQLEEKTTEYSKAEEVMNAEPLPNPFETRLEQARIDLRNEEKALSNAKGTILQPLDLFGPGIGRLVAAIKAERGWKVVPVGPVGKFITVNDKAYTAVIEAVIERSFDNFIVMHNCDKDKLRNLKNRLNIRVGSIISRYPNAWKLEELRAPDVRYTTILRAVDVSHDEVKKLLVDTFKAERAILVMRRTEGDTIMRSNQPSTSNILSCFSKDCFQVGAGKSGGSSSIALKIPENLLLGPSPDTNVLTTIQVQIDALRIEIGTLSRDELAWKETERKSQLEKKRLYNELKIIVRRLEGEIRGMDSEIEELQAELEEATPAEELVNLQKLMTDAEINQRSARAQLRAVESQKDKLALDEVMFRTEYSQAKDKIDQANLELKELDESAKKIEAVIGKARRQLDRDTLEFQTSQLKCQKLKEKTQEANFETVKAFEVANECCGNMDVAEDQAELQAQIKGIQTSIQSHKLDPHFNQAKADDAYLEICERADAAIIAVNDLRLFDIRLSKAMASRQTMYDITRDMLTTQVKLDFPSVIHEHLQLDAKLVIKHPEEKLEIKVDRGGLKDTNLSGGERSFEQLLLLISFWKSVSSPLRILDEFSVFADANTQKKMIDALFKINGDNSINQEVQYILISPLSFNLAHKQFLQTHWIQMPEKVA